MMYDKAQAYYAQAALNIADCATFMRLTDSQQKLIIRLCGIVEHETLVKVKALARLLLDNRAVTGSYAAPKSLVIVELLAALDDMGIG